jgi:hypothetical protein
MYPLHHHGDKKLLLLVTANVVPSLTIQVTLMMEAIFLRNVGSYKSHTT